MRITNIGARLEKLFARRTAARTQRLAAAALTGGMLFSGGVADAADIVVNGGFEIEAGEPGSGWTNQGGNYTHPYGGINGPQLDEVGTLNDYGFNDNISASAGTAFHGLTVPTTQTISLVNADLSLDQIMDGEGRFAFSAWLSACCNDVPKISATFDTGGSTTFNRGIVDHMVTTADILVNPGGADNARSEGVIEDDSRRFWALYEFKGIIPVNATEVTIEIADGRADAQAAGANTGGNGNDNYVDMVIFDAVRSTEVVFDSALKISIDRDSGAITLGNNTGAQQDIKGYSLFSDAGALIESNATFLSDSDPNWIQFTAAGASSDLSEGHLTTGQIDQGESINLGDAWLQYFEEGEDLTFEYVNGSGEVERGLVEFNGTQQTTPFDFGDLTFDGVIDGQDWAAYAAGLGSDLAGMSDAQSYHNGDLNGDQLNNHDDFIIFKEAYDAANGPGSFEAMVASVPEPSTIGLIIASTMGFAAVSRGRGVPNKRRQ